jgi:hypothetical protein
MRVRSSELASPTRPVMRMSHGMERPKAPAAGRKPVVGRLALASSELKETAENATPARCARAKQVPLSHASHRRLWRAGTPHVRTRTEQDCKSRSQASHLAALRVMGGLFCVWVSSHGPPPPPPSLTLTLSRSMCSSLTPAAFLSPSPLTKPNRGDRSGRVVIVSSFLCLLLSI